jgi:hypothetical protein
MNKLPPESVAPDMMLLEAEVKMFNAHSYSFIFIYSVFQRSTTVVIELVITVTVGTVQNES